MHKLTNVDLAGETADCAVCGPAVPIRVDRIRNKRVCKARLRARKADKQRRSRQENPWKYALTTRTDRVPIEATVEEVEEAARRQKSKCAICKEELKLYLDHCHETGRFRGLLCNQCNLGLGQFKDDPERLQAAIDYLAAAASATNKM